jgi:glucosamine--fructose-6-phosphate aminotransferase (isomerizing)
MSLHSEIFEQPVCLERTLVSQRKNVEEIARTIRSQDIRFAYLAARGTSDNACRYANYLWGAFNGLALALATPSLYTYYQQPQRLENALVVGVSQSGRSPDIVSVLEEGKRQGNLTLAITNTPNSPLAQSADMVLDIEAGPELAVAATKTYTAELMAIAMLSAALGSDSARRRELERVAGWVDDALQQDLMIQETAQRYRHMEQCVVLGRGFNYATAFEWALKLKELASVKAEPFSAADFKHGPVAMLTPGFPVLTVMPEGKVFPAMWELQQYLKSDLQAELVVISNSPAALSLANTPFPIPVGVPEWLSPLVSIVPAQLFSYHLTLAKGNDPEHPRTIRKVTETH